MGSDSEGSTDIFYSFIVTTDDMTDLLKTKK